MPEKKEFAKKEHDIDASAVSEAMPLLDNEPGIMSGVVNPALGTYGSTMFGAMPGAVFSPVDVPMPTTLDGSEMNPLYDPFVNLDSFAHRDLHQNDVDALQRLLQTRLGQIEMLKQFSLNNDNEETRQELHALQAQYERMAGEIRQVILFRGDQPQQSLDFGGRIQSLMHSWQAMTNEGAAAVDIIMNAESETLEDEEQIVATMHSAECRDLASRQLGEERQIYQRLRELAQRVR